MISNLIILLFIVGFFLPVFGPGLSPSKRFGVLGIQLLLLALGLGIGWAVIGQAWWESTGGCAGNGGGFEGACGYAGVAVQAISAILTGGALVTISGLVMFWRALVRS